MKNSKKPTDIKKWLNTIQCMDCLDGLAQLPDNYADLVIADPPYGISRTINCENERLGTTAKLNFNFGEWDKFTQEWFELSLKKTKGWIISFCAKQHISTLLAILEKEKFKAIDVIVWQKPDPVPFNGKSKFLNAWEAAVIGKKGGKWNGYCEHNILKFQAPKGKTRIHPTQKPLGLISKLISLTTQEGDLVIDPFMGSGTAAIACKQLRRNFIGFEVSKKFHKMAIQRLKETPNSLDL
ncbi:MAG: site-specific DNA-methyltransferase [Candidatus Taylorbacteria bacterium]|nr:site-specific DNA-methyltransferase [Candidatus Taylorbacteria bacterium]